MAKLLTAKMRAQTTGTPFKKILGSGAITLIVALFALATPHTATAAPISINVTNVVYITDGDTFTITTDTAHKVLVGKRFTVRIKDIDTPELKAKCAAERQYALDAKTMLENMLRQAELNRNKIEVVSHYRDRFGRLVADVLIHQNNTTINVGNALLSKGLALPYSAKGHNNNYSNFWCN